MHFINLFAGPAPRSRSGNLPSLNSPATLFMINSPTFIVFEHLLRRYEPSPQEVLEVLELHQLSFEFRQEQHSREALEDYCEEHYRLAQQHQTDHAAMQHEPNLFALFWRKQA